MNDGILNDDDRIVGVNLSTLAKGLDCTLAEAAHCYVLLMRGVGSDDPHALLAWVRRSRPMFKMASDLAA